MTTTRKIGAATALWLWHDWKKSGRALGWHRSSVAAEIRELQGYGKTQQPKRHGDPTSAASIAFDIAMTVDRIIHELDEDDAQLLILRQIGRLTYEEIGDHVGHTRNWASQNCQRVHSLFCARLDA